MRFLLFNIVVAGALVFLFTSDRADLHAAADRAHEAANDIKSKAFEVIGAQDTPRVERIKPSAPAAKPAEQPAHPVETREAKSAPDQTEETFSENKPLTPAAADAVREVQNATRKLIQPVEPVPPAVAQRREEVLAEGVVGGAATARQEFMPPATRKRDLMLLSEEMELFSAQAISR